MGNGEKRKWLKAFPIDIERLYEKVDEPLPNSAKRWWWCWGGIVGLLFLLQVVTGLLLAFYYRADPQTAFSTVNFITEHARYGQFLRSVHQWGATFMIIFLFLHLLRVFVVGAFREYRWGSWMVGVCLFAITLGLCFTGYSLVSDQLSYWGITVTSNILANVPLVGGVLKNLFLAGDEVSSVTLSRMYALHVQILPASLILLMLVHLFFVRLMGMHVPGTKEDREKEKALSARGGVYHFYPDHLASEVAIFLYLVVVICLLALVAPAFMGAPADPLVTPEHIKPEWYFYPFFHLLKIVPGPVGVTLMMLLGFGFFFWPILDQYLFQKIDKFLKNRIESGLLLGLIVLGFYLAWAVVEVH